MPLKEPEAHRRHFPGGPDAEKEDRKKRIQSCRAAVLLIGYWEGWLWASIVVFCLFVCFLSFVAPFSSSSTGWFFLLSIPLGGKWTHGCLSGEVWNPGLSLTMGS